jgi:hypothetical protein
VQIIDKALDLAQIGVNSNGLIQSVANSMAWKHMMKDG